MKHIIYLAFVVMLLAGAGWNNEAKAQTSPEAIINALKSGNMDALSKNFDNMVDITILDKQSSYSQSQAGVVVRDFFSHNQPKNFEALHDGASGGSKYTIGNLSTSGGTYRTYIYMKSKGSGFVVQELRFEK